MTSLYYAPYEWGLEFVASHETKGEPYQFSLVAVFKDPVTGEYFWAQDSGCSCPVPFERHARESLEHLTLQNWAYFEKTVRGSCEGYTDPNSFLETVEQVLKLGELGWPLSAYRKD